MKPLDDASDGGTDWPRLLAERSPDMAVVLDASFVPLWVSPSANRLFGFADGELETSSLGPNVNPADLGALSEAVITARAHPSACVPVSFRASNVNRTTWVDCEGWLTDLGPTDDHALLIRFRRQSEVESTGPAAAERDPFLALTENSSSGFALVGPFGGIGYRNPTFASWFPAAAMMSLSDLPNAVATGSRPALQHWVEVLGDDRPGPVTVALDEAGQTRWLRCDAVPLHPDNSQGMALGLTVHDVTDQLNAHESLRQVIDLVPHLVYAVDADGRVRFANRATATFVGVEAHELEGRRLSEAIQDRAMDDILGSAPELIEHQQPVRDLEDLVTGPDGAVHFLRTSLIPYLDAGSGTPALLGVSTDVTREITSETRLSAMGRNMPDLAMIIDTDGRRTFVSDSVQVLLGWTPGEWTVLDHASSIHPEDLAGARAAFDPSRTEPGARSRIELRFAHHDGSWQWFEVGTVNLEDEAAIGGMLLFGRDITARKEQDDRLRYEATHDPLSDLLNRSAVIAELELALNEARVDGTTVGALFCDLDNFKMVNDGLGHEVGDHLLQRISRRMRGAVRAGDVVGRLGGDEFLIVARSIGDEGQLVSLADRVARTVADDLRGTPFPVSLSIGAAAAVAGQSSAGALVRDADAAMYRSKSSGKARVEVFRSGMRDRSERHLEVGRLLRNALDDGWITVHYQPVFAQQDGRWVLRALEALARFPMPDGTFMSPGEFIPVAEQTGLISRLGRRVRKIAAQDLARWTTLHGDGFGTWVNMSVQELDRGDIPEQFASGLAAAGVDPTRVGIEITESAMAAGHPIAMATVAELRSSGMTVIIDDFGTGYSSLSAIKDYPADVVKVDRSFISGILDAPADLAIVRSVVEIGEVIGLEIVAEGVETADQLRALTAAGCTVAQGFHLARPAPASAIEERLRGWLRGDLGVGAPA